MMAKVLETEDEKKIYHMVFFDHHGWYCEHGMDCPATEVVQQEATPTTGSRRA